MAVSALEAISQLTFSSVLPTPTPPAHAPSTTSPTRTDVCDSLNAAWTALSARVASEPGTTAEMFLSDNPCAMARTLIFDSPRALKNLPATPVVLDMPSPTAAAAGLSE